MDATAALTELGQSIWVDDIRRDLLDDGTLQRWRDELHVTGLTSNPSIFEHAIAKTDLYDDAIAELVAEGTTEPEKVLFELAIDDLARAADLFDPTWESTGGRDGFVSLEVSPLLADDDEGTIQQAAALHAQAARDNLLIKIPGTPAGIPAITETIASGVPVNVTLLFSPAQYEAQLEAWLTGLEKRHEAGQPLAGVASVASIFVSRWDVAANPDLPDDFQNRLGVAVCASAYARYRQMLDSDRWARLADAGATPQRLLFASTSMKDPAGRDTAYVEALAAPDTVDTMPIATLKALDDHGEISEPLPADGGDAADALARAEASGVDVEQLAERLQDEGKKAFVASWESLLDSIENQIDQLS